MKRHVFLLVAFLCLQVTAKASTLAPLDPAQSFNPNELSDYFFNGGEKNVFGKDDRKAMTSSRFPWSAVTRIQVGSGWCTGSLVWKNLVLTNAHCIMDKGRLTKKVIWVYPNYKGGKYKEKAYAVYAWWGTSKPNKYRGKDWAILKINKPLGLKYGYFGWKTLSFSRRQLKWRYTMAGYSGNFMKGKTAGVHIGCRIRKKKSTVLYHDCDASRGSSGSGIWGIWKSGNKKNYQIVALNAAEKRKGGNTSLYVKKYSDKYANVAVKVKRFSKKLKELRKKNP